MNSAIIKCPECPYDKARNLGTHLFFVHGYSKNRIAEWRMNIRADTLSRTRNYEVFKCQFCPKTYRRQNSCRAHERSVHCVTFNSRQKCVPCPVLGCQFTTTALLDLCAHAKESHSNLGDFTIREARFQNMELFNKWRAQYEERTATVLATESVNSNAADGTTLRYLRCAQLEAQIRKARNQVRLSEARARASQGEGPDSEEFEEEEEQGARQEEKAPSPPGRNQPYNLENMGGHNLRSVRKRKAEEEEVEIRQEQSYAMKRAKQEDEEEEEIDVEQLDEEPPEEEEEAMTSAAAAAAAAVKKKPAASTRKRVKEEAPRLQPASSAHMDHNEADDDDEEEDDDEDGDEMPAELEMERRMNSRHCTAHMRVVVLRGGEVHVEYCVSHLGHDVIPIPLSSRGATSSRAERAVKTIKPLVTIKKEAEELIERAKARRKGRRETEHRWRTERRLRSERDEFEELCGRYDNIAANVELYETVDDSGAAYDDDEIPEEEVEEVVEAEEVDHEELVEAD